MKINKTNSNSNLYKLFEKELNGFIIAQVRNNYSKYWILAKMYQLYPNVSVSPIGLTILSTKTKINKKTIQWYIDTNGRGIIEDAIKKFGNKSFRK